LQNYETQNWTSSVGPYWTADQMSCLLPKIIYIIFALGIVKKNLRDIFSKVLLSRGKFFAAYISVMRI